MRSGAERRERLAASRLYVCTPIRPDLAHRAGRIPRRLYAEASTPAEGTPDLSS